jgi:hypothetical protein
LSGANTLAYFAGLTNGQSHINKNAKKGFLDEIEKVFFFECLNEKTDF